MPDVVVGKGQSISPPWKCQKQSEEVSITYVQTNVVRALQQMKRPQTKTGDKHYTEGKPTCTDVSKPPCSIQIIR